MTNSSSLPESVGRYGSGLRLDTNYSRNCCILGDVSKFVLKRHQFLEVVYFIFYDKRYVMKQTTSDGGTRVTHKRLEFPKRK